MVHSLSLSVHLSLFFGVSQERLLIAVMAIASCEFMFEETRNYVTQRKAFGKTIAHLQVCNIYTHKHIHRGCFACTSMSSQ